MCWLACSSSSRHHFFPSSSSGWWPWIILMTKSTFLSTTMWVSSCSECLLFSNISFKHDPFPFDSQSIIHWLCLLRRFTTRSTSRSSGKRTGMCSAASRLWDQRRIWAKERPGTWPCKRATSLNLSSLRSWGLKNRIDGAMLWQRWHRLIIAFRKGACWRFFFKASSWFLFKKAFLNI